MNLAVAISIIVGLGAIAIVSILSMSSGSDDEPTVPPSTVAVTRE